MTFHLQPIKHIVKLDVGLSNIHLWYDEFGDCISELYKIIEHSAFQGKFIDWPLTDLAVSPYSNLTYTLYRYTSVWVEWSKVVGSYWKYNIHADRQTKRRISMPLSWRDKGQINTHVRSWNVIFFQYDGLFIFSDEVCAAEKLPDYKRQLLFFEAFHY